MFSITTMASSTTNPVEMAKAISERLSMLYPSRYIAPKVPTIESGTETLGIKPLWQLSVGNYLLLAVTSSLIALPAHQVDALPEEWSEWQQLREDHLSAIRSVFDSLQPGQRVILFCHDPTALPFLAKEESVQHRLAQIEQTIIGHLHTDLILWKSRLFAGMPVVRAFGPAVYRPPRQV